LQLLEYGFMDASGLALPEAGVRVMVETVLLGHVGPYLTYRTARAELIDRDHPDALARALVGFDTDSRVAGGLLHSTSWRFAADCVVLTYAGLPDPNPLAACRLDPHAGIARSTDELAPSPGTIHLEHVATHACRHLVFLRATDPLVATQADRLPDLWALIDAHRPSVAGRLPTPAMSITG
jgi:hypothetical protein